MGRLHCRCQTGFSQMKFRPYEFCLATFVGIYAFTSQSVGTEFPLKVSNVCLIRIPKYHYDVENVVDFKIIRADRNGVEVFKVYVGANPEMLGRNERFLDPSRIRKNHAQVLKLGSPQNGQYLGIPTSIDDDYFHLFPSSRAQDIRPIVRSIKFCSN